MQASTNIFNLACLAIVTLFLTPTMVRCNRRYNSEIRRPNVARQSNNWSYDNPQSWAIDSPSCNGNLQSPIHIICEETLPVNLPQIKFGNYGSKLADNLNLTNNGYSVDISVPLTTNGERPFITGGLLKNKYEAVSVHFHWGAAGTKGSEHVIDNRRYDMEMHIVHRNVKYSTLEEATRNEDGLAVLAVMFEIADRKPIRSNPVMNSILSKLTSLVNFGSSVVVTESLTLTQMLGNVNTKHFYAYRGSLTTPNCAEAVSWHIFSKPLHITKKQMEQFWSLLDINGKALVNNFRPLQNANKRIVMHSVALGRAKC